MGIETGGPSEEEMSFNAEQETEFIPSPEEVASVFKELGLENYTETRKLEDEKGLYLWEVEVPGETENTVKEYSYMRKGKYGKMGITDTEIHVTSYEDGIPHTGTSAAKYEDGKWRIIE
ncbi:MAG TPA: hypothetical protein VHQ41_00705 [Patescibacteria group bacterium]|jgi:hypothetical protein|nr:hypothetical protein [Patescibacteria group bacterium]